MRPANSFRSIVAVLFGAALSAPVHAQSPTVYRGMCDASASVPLGKDHFVVADDEANVLMVYRRGQADRSSEVPLLKFLGTAAGKESDLEGAATIGKRTYWISSHGTNKDGEVQDRRKRFFATEMVNGAEPTVQPVDKPYSKLLEDLSKDSRFKKYDLANAAKKPPKSEGALNIEGLAATDDGRLLIGFRNPLSKEDPVTKERQALVIPLLEPEKLTAGSAGVVAQFGEPIELFLENRGIRSIENDGQGGYLIVAGAIDEENTSLLFRWSGKKPVGKIDQPTPVSKVDFTGLNPEAMHLIPGTNDVEILSDDGNVKTAGVKCKDLKDASKKSFRGIILKPADLKP
jgi:hypothetical protein